MSIIQILLTPWMDLQRPLIAHVSVIPSHVYHLKLAISDVSDGILNSFVILKANRV
ncbi:MAG: choice-of-anchor L domain-containing protein [Bacteroidetes bacterium]|nr:choice-of-anchor L domain-containing protein [Bacteroidota bacterium]